MLTPETVALFPPLVRFFLTLFVILFIAGGVYLFAYYLSKGGDE